MSDPHSIWSKTVALEDIPERGLHVHVVADEATRQRLAQAASLRDITRLEASADLTRQAGQSVRVTGEVVASIGQTCVVSLEPTEAQVHEAFDLVFSPQEPGAGAATTAEVPFDGEEPPELLTGGLIDLGAIAAEFFLLGIDPYPRKSGVVFEVPKTAEDPSSHPFAALAALKKGKTDEKS